jgi:hypothetical protein
MRRWLTVLSRVALVVGALLALGSTVAQATPDDAPARARLAGVRVPFIVNQGRTDARVAFHAPTFAGTLFVTKKGDLVYALPAAAVGARRDTRGRSTTPGWTLTERLQGGRVRPLGQDPSATGVSYFVGNDPTRWRPAVPTYDQLSLGEVWPGVTVALRARGRSVEKVFTVLPGASVARIRVRVSGTKVLAVDADGALIARTGLGPVTFTAPVAYQEQNGVRREVAVTYQVTGREYGFTVAAYDPTLPLVIDPLLQSTYLGGTGDDMTQAIAVHPKTGDVYVAGSTTATDFPHTAGGARPASGGNTDAVVVRLNASLTSVIQATYLGGSGTDVATALAIDPVSGDVFVAGHTTSTDLPVFGGDAQVMNGGGLDAFVLRLTGSLTTLTRGTYLGGSGDESAAGLAIHPVTGDVYVAGYTSSTNFPRTAGGAQPTFGGPAGDAFVARLPSTLTSITQATYLGGSNTENGFAMAIHPTTGDVYVTGFTFSTNFPHTAGGAQPASGGNQDCFVVRLPSSLTSVIQATYLGGSANDVATALAIDPVSGDVFVAGHTTSTDLPVFGGDAQVMNGGGLDAFVLRLTGSLTTLTRGTYLGGSGDDSAVALAIHPTTGDVYVAGNTSSSNFPRIAGGAQPAFANAFAARLTGTLTSITQATYLGGGDSDSAAVALAIHPTTGDVYVVGTTSSTNFPHVAGGAQTTKGTGTDAFASRLTFSLALVDPTLGVTASVNQPSFAAGQTLTVGGTVTNPGLPQSADFYVGILRPDGSIQFFTNGGIVLGNVANLATFQPLAVGAQLGTPFSVAAPGFYTHQWAASEHHGGYVFFVAAVKAGALAGGTVTNDKILGLGTAPFSFP